MFLGPQQAASEIPSSQQITFGVQIHVHALVSKARNLSLASIIMVTKCNTERYCALAIYRQQVHAAEARGSITILISRTRTRGHIDCLG